MTNQSKQSSAAGHTAHEAWNQDLRGLPDLLSGAKVFLEDLLAERDRLKASNAELVGVLDDLAGIALMVSRSNYMSGSQEIVAGAHHLRESANKALLVLRDIRGEVSK